MTDEPKSKPGPKHIWVYKDDFDIFTSQPVDKTKYVKYVKAPPEKQK
jgi:hypothetical protein